jgi:hypothetical protein
MSLLPALHDTRGVRAVLAVAGQLGCRQL